MAASEIVRNPAHLGLGATTEIEPTFTGSPDWYAAYEARHAVDGVEGRLVSMFTFDRSWDSWEVHPNGSELVLCAAGEITLIQEKADGTTNRVTLLPGQYAVNEPGTWHTADVAASATAVFITAGAGTQIRPRQPGR
ncbi:MAG: hypothetical protein AB7I04_07935 [Pseudomonadales bacterium]